MVNCQLLFNINFKKRDRKLILPLCVYIISTSPIIGNIISQDKSIIIIPDTIDEYNNLCLNDVIGSLSIVCSDVRVSIIVITAKSIISIIII